MTEREMVDWVEGIIRDYGDRDDLRIIVGPDRMTDAEVRVATDELCRRTGRDWHVNIARGFTLR